MNAIVLSIRRMPNGTEAGIANYNKTRNLTVPIVVHTLWNFLFSLK